MLKIILILTMISPVLAKAQTGVAGRVIIQDGTPIAGVNVFCSESLTGTSSDSAGYFYLECQIPCTLEFSHINYKKESCRITYRDAPFVVVLRNKFNNLEEVLVTGRSTPGRTYSSKETIEMIPAILGEKDILKYLATTPGIITTNALDPGIYVRGSNSSENSFLTDDIEIANPDHLTGILSTFDPYVLNSSTIWKSGYPANYNSFLASYLNMKPDPGNKQKYEGELTLGVVSSSIKAKGPLVKNHTSFATSVRTSYLQSIAKLYNKSVKGPGEQNSIPEYSFNDVALSLDSRLSEKWRASGFGLFTKDKLFMELSPTLYYDFNWHTFSGNAGAWYTPDSKNQLQFRLGFKSAFSEGKSTGAIPIGGGNRHYSVIGRIAYTHLFTERLQISSGIRFEYARFETADRPDVNNDILIKSSDESFHIYEIYADINYEINKYFKIYGGLNCQFYNGRPLSLTYSPRAKLTFSHGGFSLWGDYAQTAQYLSLYPYLTVKTPIDIWYPLPKDMKPAICHQFSIGAEQQLGRGLSAYAGIFYKKMERLKDFSAGISTKYTALTNNMIMGQGRAKGVELYLALHREKISARINYTLSESKRKFPGINNGKEFYPPYDVKHNLVINSSWSISQRFKFNVLWSYSSGVYTTFPVGVVIAHNISNSQNQPILVPVYTDRYNYKLPDSHRLDLNLDYSIPCKHVNLILSAGAYNVYNQSNPSFVYFKPEEDENGNLRFIPKSKVMLPFIPYVSIRLKL